MREIYCKRLIRIFKDKGCDRVYVKVLADNDNSKNQVYLGSDFKSINIIPYQELDTEGKIYKAKLNFSWVNDGGNLCPAPHTQLILYPQYPEVRFSGFLLGSKMAPSDLMTKRESGRLLFLGVKSSDRTIIGYVSSPQDLITKEFENFSSRIPQVGVFFDLSAEIFRKDPKSSMLNELKRIHQSGWIISKRLNSEGKKVPCKAPNCGGYTLEAELNIIPNGRSEPDYMGWEVKQHGVVAFDKIAAGAITLMTPEPTGGMYKTCGVIDFVKKYGYKDPRRSNRMNFGGIHRINQFQGNTQLKLCLIGYDYRKARIVDNNGGIALVSKNDKIAAIWNFSGLMTHWNRKHAHAVYVPSMVKKPKKQLLYWYGNIIRLGENTDFLKFLKAIADDKVYYDPGIKVEKLNSSKPSSKRRSQFRIKSGNIDALYEQNKKVDLLKI